MAPQLYASSINYTCWIVSMTHLSGKGNCIYSTVCIVGLLLYLRLILSCWLLIIDTICFFTSKGTCEYALSNTVTSSSNCTCIVNQWSLAGQWSIWSWGKSLQSNYKQEMLVSVQVMVLINPEYLEICLLKAGWLHLYVSLKAAVCKISSCTSLNFRLWTDSLFASITCLRLLLFGTSFSEIVFASVKTFVATVDNETGSWSVDGKTGSSSVNGRMSSWSTEGETGSWSTDGETGSWSAGGETGSWSAGGETGSWSGGETGSWSAGENDSWPGVTCKCFGIPSLILFCYFYGFLGLVRDDYFSIMNVTNASGAVSSFRSWSKYAAGITGDDSKTTWRKRKGDT